MGDARSVGDHPGDVGPQPEFHAEPTARLGQTRGEPLRVTAGVGDVVDRPGESRAAVRQRGFQRGDLVGTQRVLNPAVVAQQHRLPFCCSQFRFVTVQIEHAAVGVAELDALAGGQLVGQALAVCGQGELGERVGLRAARCALAQEAHPQRISAASRRGVTRIDVWAPSSERTSMAGAPGEAQAYE